MTLSPEDFEEQLVQSGLWSAADAAVLRAETAPVDAQAFAQALVEKKTLTPYQAEQLCSGNGVGLVLGNYVILEKIGQGGMGVVFKARHRRMDRIVAIKVLSPQFIRSPDQIARFHQEMQAAARLQHPNIVTAHDADEVRGMHFFVMEYAAGADLASLVAANGPLSVDEALECLLQAATGLEYAHRQKIIHRDIKPANLLLDTEGTVKILDMGLARIERGKDDLAGLTNSGAIMGTVDFMAPEQALNTKTADARSDIYSLGVTLWYLLLGRPLYGGESLMAKLVAHREAPIPSLRGSRGDVPAALDELFQRMVAKRPADRCQSMTEVIAPLKACIETRGQPPEGPLVLLTRSAETLRAAAPMMMPVTRTVLHPDQETDPKSAPPRSRTRPRPETQSNIRRLRIQLMIGVCSMIIAAGLFWWPSYPPQKVNLQPSPPSIAKVKQATTTTNPDEKAPDSPVNSGNAALALDRVGARVELPPSLYHDTSHEITIEAWVSRPPVKESISFGGFLIGSKACGLRWESSGHVQLDCGFRFSEIATFIERSRPTHVAVVTDKTTCKLFVDGAESTHSSVVMSNSPVTARYTFCIGGFPEIPENGDRGLIDEIRISRIARYPSRLAPPFTLTVDDDTLALYHCDEGSGHWLKDASGHGHDGLIIGARWIPEFLSATDGPR